MSGAWPIPNSSKFWNISSPCYSWVHWVLTMNLNNPEIQGWNSSPYTALPFWPAQSPPYVQYEILPHNLQCRIIPQKGRSQRCDQNEPRWKMILGRGSNLKESGSEILKLFRLHCFMETSVLGFEKIRSLEFSTCILSHILYLPITCFKI